MYLRDNSQQETLAVFLARCLTWTRQRTTRGGADSQAFSGSLDSRSFQRTGSDEGASENPRSTLLFRKAGSEASNLPELSTSVDAEEIGFSANNLVKEEVNHHKILMRRRGTSSEEENGTLKSTFLSQLPIEVRLFIYEYVFGSLGSHMADCYFFETSPSQGGSNASPYVWASPHPFEDRENAVALLRTCRQVYQEAIDTFLNGSFFYVYFRGPRSPRIDPDIRLRVYRAPELCLIGHLDIHWNYYDTNYPPISTLSDTTNDIGKWEQLWAAVAAHMRLTHLGLNLVYFGPEDQMHAQATWLTPVRHIRRIKDVKIEIRHIGNIGQIQAALNQDLERIMTAENAC